MVILSDGYWNSRFGGDRSILGRRIVLDGHAYEVVGVMPPAFQFMDRKVSLLVPLRLNRADIRLISFCCQGIARLKPGVTLTQANADVARMLRMAPAKFPLNPGFSAAVLGGIAHRSAFAFAEGRTGWRHRKNAVGADGHGGYGPIDRLRQRGESAPGARGWTPT